ncbi:MAG TPA: ATP-dependent helicase HrpB, partial [Prevotella sp.]|nr:ATP-dependent helicase HrpB [Candidatus Segatella violae]
MNIEEIIARSGHLPASEIAEEVNETLELNNILVITAPPGAGKSTLLPLTIWSGNKHFLSKDEKEKKTKHQNQGKILMLEPRRLAARQIAERMASIIGEPVGKTVGYRVRFDNKISKDTRIEVLTEGILTRMLVSDPTLEGVSTIIFDEFHERSINSDLALALTLQAQGIIRPDLRIVIMSATIDASGICQALHAPLIESKGRMYPVEIIYEDTTGYKNSYGYEDCAVATAAIIAKAHHAHKGDILAFLPGQGEIQRCLEILGDSLAPTTVYPLYGNLSPEMQRKAIAPSKEGERKVVLATPIAETSLTIEGVRIVIDSGLYKKLVFDTNTGLSHLETTRISMDMATQRMGRAGRVAEGFCYRLWPKTSEHLMAERRTPEIEEADLSSMILDIASFGESKVEALPWLTMPPKANVLAAKELLYSLGAIETKEKENKGGFSEKADAEMVITSLGRKMELLPCHPRIARMILSAKGKGLKALACDIAALLEEKDPMAESGECDITLRLSILRSNRRKNTLGRWARIAQIAKEYNRMVWNKTDGTNHSEHQGMISGKKVFAEEDNSPVDGEEAGMLLAYAYPERIAKAMDNIGGFKLANGNKVSIDHNDPMSARPWIAIASLYAGNGRG